MNKNIEEILSIIKTNKNYADTIDAALSMIGEPEHKTVCIKGLPINDITVDSRFIIADILTNFRLIDGSDVGHLCTKMGIISIPKFWPVTEHIQNIYGIPYREKELIADVYLLNAQFHAKIYKLTDIPGYTDWLF